MIFRSPRLNADALKLFYLMCIGESGLNKWRCLSHTLSREPSWLQTYRWCQYEQVVKGQIPPTMQLKCTDSVICKHDVGSRHAPPPPPPPPAGPVQRLSERMCKLPVSVTPQINKSCASCAIPREVCVYNHVHHWSVLGSDKLWKSGFFVSTEDFLHYSEESPLQKSTTQLSHLPCRSLF